MESVVNSPITFLNNTIRHLENDIKKYYNLWKLNCRNRNYEHFYQMHMICKQALEDAYSLREDTFQMNRCNAMAHVILQKTNVKRK